MRPSWFKISVILGGLWLFVGSAMWWLHERQPSMEKVVAFAATHPGIGKAETERTEDVRAVASQYQRLNFDDRGELLVSEQLKPWWTALAKPERRSFRHFIFPQSLKVVDFFDKLEPDKRAKNINRILEEVKKKGGEGRLPNMSPQVMALITATGLKPYFDSTLLDDNMDTLMIFHELEKRMVWMRTP